MAVMSRDPSEDEVTFLRVEWHHDNPADPVQLFSALDAERWERRKVKIWADGSSQTSDSRLGTAPIPTLAEIAADPQFSVTEISAAEFDAVWVRNVSILTRATEAKIIAGARYDHRDRKNNDVRASERQPQQIAQLLQLVQARDPHSARADWMEEPAYSVVFLGEQLVLGTYGLLTGCEWVRHTHSEGDHRPLHPTDLRAWLAAHGAED